MNDSETTAAPLRLKEMSPPDIAAALVRDPRLIVPVGTCENHGHHMPLGAGTIIVERLADELSAAFGVLRAPTVEFGVNAFSDRESPGNGSVRRKTLHRMLNDLLASWECNRVRTFVLITAQGYNQHLDALSSVITGNSVVRVIDVLSIGIGDLLEGQPGPLRGDEADTSLLLFLAPSLVHRELIQDYMMSMDEARRYRRASTTLDDNAESVPCTPSLATAEKGERIYMRIRERVAARVFERDVARELEAD